MNHTNILLGGECYSIEFYFKGKDLIIYSILDSKNVDVFESIPDETFEELIEIISFHYGSN